MRRNADSETLNAGEPAVEQQHLSRTSAPRPAESGGTVLLQLLEFKTHLLEAVEELHIRKDAETHFEDQISQLVLEKQELEWEKESLQHQTHAAEHRHTESLAHVKKQFQAKIRIAEEEKGKYQVSAELKDKEINNLKEELRSLQLLKYNLEKKSKELEQKLSLQSRSRDRHLNQLGEVEKRFGALSRQCAAVKQAHEKLEQNVDEAMRTNMKLTSANEKQEATIVSLRKELAEANSKLIKAKTTSARRDASHVHTGKEQHVETLQQKLSMETEMNRKLREENVAVRAEKQEVMRSLQQNQQLLLSQTQAVNRVELELQTQREQNQALKQERRAMRDKSEAAEDEAARLTESAAVAATTWDKEKKMLLGRVKAEQRDLRAARDAHDELQRLNAELSSQAREQAQHIVELETRTSRQSFSLRVSAQLFPPDGHTSGPELPRRSASSRKDQNPDRPDDTGATGGREASNQRLQPELKQPSPSGTTGADADIMNEYKEDPGEVSDPTSSVSDDKLLISEGSCASGHEDEEEEEGNTGMNEEEHGEQQEEEEEEDDQGQERNNRKEEEGNAEQLWNRGEDAEEGGRTGEKGGTPTTRTTGSSDGREESRGSAEDTRRDGAEGRGTDGAETQTPADNAAEKSNSLQVVDSAVVCERDADSRPEDEGRGTGTEGRSLHSFGPDDAQSVGREQNLRHHDDDDDDDEVHTRDAEPLGRPPSPSQVSDKTSADESAAELSEPLRVCGSQTNVVPSATDDVIGVRELETTAEQSEPCNNNNNNKPSDVKRTDETCRIQASEESVRTSVERQSQETSELRSLTTEEDDAGSSAKSQRQVSNVDMKREPCGGESVCVDVTVDTGREETSVSRRDRTKDDDDDDAGDPEADDGETDVNVSVATSGPGSSVGLTSVPRQFVQESESNLSVSCGRLRLPPSRKPTFPKSKPGKVPPVFTGPSELLRPSGVSGNAASSPRQWSASGETPTTAAAANTEGRASLSVGSFTVPTSFSGLSWPTTTPTTPGSAPSSAAGPVPPSDLEQASCSQQREEQQQASFRAQISKIERFLDTERLRLPKRRRTDD